MRQRFLPRPDPYQERSVPAKRDPVEQGRNQHSDQVPRVKASAWWQIIVGHRYPKHSLYPTFGVTGTA